MQPNHPGIRLFAFSLVFPSSLPIVTKFSGLCLLTTCLCLVLIYRASLHFSPVSRRTGAFVLSPSMLFVAFTSKTSFPLPMDVSDLGCLLLVFHIHTTVSHGAWVRNYFFSYETYYYVELGQRAIYSHLRLYHPLFNMVNKGNNSASPWRTV